MTHDASEGGQATRDSGRAPCPPEVLEPRTFWIVFTSGWLVYAILACSTIVMEGEGLVTGVVGSLAVVVPLVLPAVPLAARRRRLLQPRSSLARFVTHKALVGLGYAVTVAALGGVLTWLTPIQPMRELSAKPVVAALAWLLSGLFLYTVFLVFLMWLDALERVQETRSLAAQEAVLRAEAEAKALRAQFNPHFVFNTLHSLMLLVRKDPETAERAIEDVAALIRYASTLQRREVDQVTLTKELAFAKRYLALEKLRLAHRLSVAWSIDAGLDDVLVPAFSLQTLLENSIKHGISAKADGGAVRIRARLCDGYVTMTVEDDGLGVDPALVAVNAGSGLNLLRRRLGAVYDGRASLDWETSPGEGFRARLRLPERRAPHTPAPSV